MGSKKGGSGDRKVEAYFYGVYYGVCVGPVNRINEIKIADKDVPNTAFRSNISTFLSEPALFGGEKSEGGLGVVCEIYLGGPTQQLYADLASKHGGTPATVPGYRGLCSVYLNGWWAYDNSYVRTVAVNATCIPQDWYPAKSAIFDDLTTSKYIEIYIDVGPTADLATEKTVVNNMLDIIQTSVDNGYSYGLSLQEFGSSAFSSIGFNTSGSPNTIADLKAWVNARTSAGQTGSDMGIIGGAFGVSVGFNVSLTGGWDRRIFILVSSGDCVVGSDDATAASPTMSDMLSETGGSFNVVSGTYVECYAMNVIKPDTSHSVKLDNTTVDGVPVVGVDGSVPYSIAHAIGVDTNTRPDMNPAHIIYHTLTNTDWGMAAPTYALDETSFIACADTLYDEAFGLSVLWDKQSSIETFVNEILNHINGTLFLHPSTGLLTLKLIRNDYVAGALQVLDEDDITVTSFARKSWADTTNEILVQWTNPDSEQEETIPAHDLGNMAIQGGIVSDTRDYYGIRNADLAKRVALRDLSASSWPLASCELEANRTTWDYVPGEVFKLTSTEYGIVEMIVRVTTIDYGKPGDSKIKITALEDIFGLTQTQYVDNPPATGWIDPAENPSVMAFVLPFTMSYYQLAKILGVANVSDSNYPSVGVSIFAAQTNSDTFSFELFGPKTTIAGLDPYADIGQRRTIVHATLTNNLAAAASNTLNLSTDFTDRTYGALPTVNWIMVIGNGVERAVEECVISADSSGSLTVRRGVLDTIPRAWPAGTPVWFYDGVASIADPNERSALETVSYKVCAITTNGTFPVSSALPISLIATERPYLPLRPANVTCGGQTLGQELDARALTTFDVTWVKRNRITEDNVILAWDDATVAPEVGQTTTLTIYGTNGTTVLTTLDGLTGTSHTFTVASDFTGATDFAFIKVTSKRAGYESLQGMTFKVLVPSTSDDDYAAYIVTDII